MEEIKIWRCSEDGETVEALPPARQMNYENTLENLLVKNPEMIEPGLKLIGRQLETESGYPDLLGLDLDNKLVVFELKRGNLTREAVAQVLDYGSWIESINEEQLLELLTSGGGVDGIEEIDDFHSWFRNLREGELDLSILRPVRMVLIGLGTDDRAVRIVKYLAERNVNISILTFHGYQDNQSMLLARQVEVQVERDDMSSWQNTRLRKYKILQNQVQNCGSRFVNLWYDVITSLDLNSSRHNILSDGMTRNQKPITVGHEYSFGASHSVRVVEDCKIRVTFFPIAIHLCTEEFNRHKVGIGFREEVPNNAPYTDKVSNQWYCMFDEQGWKIYKKVLTELTKSLQNCWDDSIE